MSEFGDLLNALQTQMKAYLPDRLITRSFELFESRKDRDLRRGIWTILAKGGSDFNSPTQYRLLEGKLSIFLLGQFVTDENDPGEVVEEKEHLMYDEVVNFLQNASGPVQCLDIDGFQQSMQAERPYGWIMINLTWSDFD